MPLISHHLTVSFNKISASTSYSTLPFRSSDQSVGFRHFPRINCAKKAKRTGKLRYPSEKKRLKQQKTTKSDAPPREEGVWRIYRLAVPVQDDPGKDFWDVSEGLLREIAKVLEFPVSDWVSSFVF